MESAAVVVIQKCKPCINVWIHLITKGSALLRFPTSSPRFSYPPDLLDKPLQATQYGHSFLAQGKVGENFKEPTLSIDAIRIPHPCLQSDLLRQSACGHHRAPSQIGPHGKLICDATNARTGHVL